MLDDILFYVDALFCFFFLLRLIFCKLVSNFYPVAKTTNELE